MHYESHFSGYSVTGQKKRREITRILGLTLWISAACSVPLEMLDRLPEVKRPYEDRQT